MSIGTGVIINDEKINCHETFKNRSLSIYMIIDSDFSIVNFQRKNIKVPFKAYDSKVKKKKFKKCS